MAPTGERRTRACKKRGRQEEGKEGPGEAGRMVRGGDGVGEVNGEEDEWRQKKRTRGETAMTEEAGQMARRGDGGSKRRL